MLKKRYLVSLFIMALFIMALPVSAKTSYSKKIEISNMRYILYAVETGGMSMGHQDYSFNEISQDKFAIGAACFYDEDARQLIEYIGNHQETPDADKETCIEILNNWEEVIEGNFDIEELISIISSENGKKRQDEFTDRIINQYFKIARKYGIKDVSGRMMAVNILHMSGNTALKKVIKKSKRPYTSQSLLKGIKKSHINNLSHLKSRNKYIDKHIRMFLEE